ncbi:MAG: Gfo/Idh/MocA family oxidoreductase [Bryobacteraceae bacterium]
MQRRTFAKLAALSPAFAASSTAEVALITHADGPHLGAYIEGLAKTAEAGPVHLCDASGATVAAVRKGLGEKLVGVYKTPAEMFAARKPVAALITMEAGLAPPVIGAALDAGCHVMAEKPACVRVADFRPLAAKAKAKHRNLMLALANRVDPVMIEARRIVQSGEIGKIYGMELHTIADQTRLTSPAYHKSWTAQKARSGGGHLIWLGIHWLDLAMYISGSRITQVGGFTGNVGGQPIDTEDSASISFRFANGTLGNLTSGYYLDRGKQLFIKVWGSQGWVEVNHGTENPLEWYTNASKQARKYTPPAGVTGYTPFVTHVVRSAMGLEAPVLSPDESLAALETVFASYRAAESGRTERVGA